MLPPFSRLLRAATRHFDKTSSVGLKSLIELYFSSPIALQKAHARFGGSQGLLRSAAQSLADAGEDHHGAGAGQSVHDETRVLIRFTKDAGLLLNPEAVLETLGSAGAMKGGSEHRVALLINEERVIKDADMQAFATESIYDYLTDLLLSNYYFNDDLQMLGCYEMDGRVHLVTSQPYVDGEHPGWTELKDGLVRQGLRDPYPNSKGGNFIIDDETTGEVTVFDLHVNNVIRDKTGRLNPIDAHFYFDDRAARMSALKALGLDSASGPSDIGVALLPEYTEQMEE